MIKDTNPDHYKVDGANFIEYMNDPKISGFGNWMFANGFNSGVWASTNWISVKDRLPKDEGDVLVYGVSPRGRKKTAIMNYLAFEADRPRWALDGIWTVLYWMPIPEPPEEVCGDA